MRVICVHKCLPSNFTGEFKSPEVGDECTVTGTYLHKGKSYYFLAEYHFIIINGKKLPPAYQQSCFATLPSVTSEEVEEETREAIIM